MLWLICFICCFTPVTDEISEQEFKQLHADLVPKQATWRTIPWQTSLVKAQNIAVKENKPIFIWSMDGHPLGCT